MSNNEIILQYLLYASTYHQSHTQQLGLALEIETNSFQRFVHIFSAFVYHLLYKSNLLLAQSLGDVIEDEATVERTLNALEQDMDNQPTSQTAYEKYKEGIEKAFGIQIIDVDFSAPAQYDRKLALKRYRKGFENVAIWLKNTYCSNQSPCPVNRYRVFQSVIGKFTLKRTSAPQTLLPISAFSNLVTNLYAAPRGYTQDHLTYELFGASRYINSSQGLEPADQNDVCIQFSDKCSNGVPIPSQPDTFTYTATPYQNAMGAGNLAHELAHILINSSGFGQFDTSKLLNIGLISEISNILTNDQRYNFAGTPNEELANFIGASAVGDHSNMNTDGSSRNDGLVLSSNQFADLDVAAGTSYLGLLLEAIKVNVLRNTPPNVIAKLINQTNPVSLDATVTQQINDMRSTPDNSITTNILPTPVRTNSQVTLLGRTTITGIQWVYAAVGRPDNTTDIGWYDYGWLTGISVSSIGDIANLHPVSIDGVDPFVIITTSQGGLTVSLEL